MASQPVRGGTTAATFSADVLCMHDWWKDEVAALDAEFRKWHDDLSGVGQGAIRVNMDASHSEVHGGQSLCPGDPAAIQTVARAMREKHVGFACQPSDAVDCVASVRSSEMFKKAAGGRVVYVYAVDCAYDLRRPERSKPGRG